jgi:hypothetical protein
VAPWPKPIRFDWMCNAYTGAIAIGHRVRSKMSATPALNECQTLNVKRTAIELGVCEETIRRLVRRKVLRKLPGLRRVLISRTEIDRYLNCGVQSLFS